MQKLIHNISENYLLKVHVCVCVCVCVCVFHQSSPVIMVSKQCSYLFTPGFSFMACTGTDLTSSLCYRNLNCTTVPKHGTKIYFYRKIFESETSKYFKTSCIYTMLTLKLIFHHLIRKINIQERNV
jgi:hypothetical protein